MRILLSFFVSQHFLSKVAVYQKDAIINGTKEDVLQTTDRKPSIRKMSAIVISLPFPNGLLAKLTLVEKKM